MNDAARIPAAMGSAFGELTVIVDASNATERLPVVEEALRRHELPYQVLRVEAPGDAERAVSETLLSGGRFIVVAGGDRLVHETVNGMLEGDAAIVERPVLGIVPLGEANDVARTFGLPDDPARAVAHLTRRGTYATDVVKATVTGPSGQPVERYWVNVATVGLWALVTAREERMPAWLGRVRRFVAFWRTMATFRPVRVRVRADRRTYEGPAHTLLLGNCQFADDGMKLSPRSYPGDGVLDVQVFKGPASDAYRMLWEIARGEHLPNPRVAELKAKQEVVVDSERPLLVQVDGRVIGTTPATFALLPQTVLVKL